MTDSPVQPGLRPGDEGYEDMVEKIQAGTQTPLEQRQARWDRVQEWSATKSLFEMTLLEEEASGVLLSRERIRAILKGPRPGSVGRPKLPGLLAAERAARARVENWRARNKRNPNESNAARLAEAQAELKEATAAVRAEQKRKR